MEKLLSVTRPLSFGGFIVHLVWLHLLLGALCYASYEFIGHGMHNMPLAYFAMLCGASFVLGTVILLLIRLFAKKS